MNIRLKDIQLDFHNKLDDIYSANEVDSFFILLIESYFNLSRIQLILDPEKSITNDEHLLLLNALNDLKLQKPIQYIIGSTEFYGLEFRVNSNVLIPRPETEELVDLIIKNNKTSQLLRILDIGTGSGCIAISLAKHLAHANVYAMDISKEAIDVAQSNAKKNGVEVTFLKVDMLNKKDLKTEMIPLKFDIIVSNPPYIRELEKEKIESNVLDNEPHLALFVSNKDPLVFYNAICQFAVEKLNNYGQLYFEINQYLGAEMIDLMKTYDFKNIELNKDLSGNDRIVCGLINN